MIPLLWQDDSLHDVEASKKAEERVSGWQEREQAERSGNSSRLVSRRLFSGKNTLGPSENFFPVGPGCPWNNLQPACPLFPGWKFQAASRRFRLPTWILCISLSSSSSFPPVFQPFNFQLAYLSVLFKSQRRKWPARDSHADAMAKWWPGRGINCDCTLAGETRLPLARIPIPRDLPGSISLQIKRSFRTVWSDQSCFRACIALFR